MKGKGRGDPNWIWRCVSEAGFWWHSISCSRLQDEFGAPDPRALCLPSHSSKSCPYTSPLVEVSGPNQNSLLHHCTSAMTPSTAAWDWCREDLDFKYSGVRSPLGSALQSFQIHKQICRCPANPLTLRASQPALQYTPHLPSTPAVNAPEVTSDCRGRQFFVCFLGSSITPLNPVFGWKASCRQSSSWLGMCLWKTLFFPVQ